MAELIEPRVLKGFRDVLPEDERERKRIQRILEDSFERAGFLPIDTPVLEYADVLLGKGSGETDKQIYRFQDHGGRDVAMRFDLTVPFARFMAGHLNELPLPFRRYHISKVWRGENTQRGRYREFMQCDFDIVGTDTASADFEILLLMVRSMEALGVREFTIQLSHRGIFNRLLERISCIDQSVEILRLVDKLGKIGEAGVRAGLQEVTSKENAESILSFVRPADTYEDTLARMTEAAGGPAEDTERLAELRGYMEQLDLSAKYVLNPAITRGLDYYTGVVFETFLDKLPGIGSVLSGGRYNDLASLYTKERIPGVGASVGLDRLMAGLDELGVAKARTGTTDVLVVCMDEKLVGYYHRLADWLRSEGISCEVFPESKKLVAQFKAAEKSGIPLGLICGEDERSGDTLTLKDFRSRENLEGLCRSEFLGKVRSLLGR